MEVQKLTTLAEVLTYFARFYGTVLDEFAFALWGESLKEFDLLIVKRAFIAYVKNGKYMPKPAQIIGFAKELLQSKAVLKAKSLQKYFCDPFLESEYDKALSDTASHDKDKSKEGWAKCQELQVKMGAHYQQWVKSA